MAEVVTSRAEYDAAAGRFETMSATYRDRRAGLLYEVMALDNEWEAAQAELHRHEAFGGIPLWSHPKHDGCPAWLGTGRCLANREAG